MSLYYSTPSANSVPEYQVSGLPYVSISVFSADVQRFEFPFVTQWFYVKSLNSTIMFSEVGATTLHKFAFSSPFVQGPFNVRVKDLYIIGGSSTVQVIAGLTTVPRDKAFTLVATGSLAALTGSVPATDLNFVSYVGI
jgi:hypothetical protein